MRVYNTYIGYKKKKRKTRLTNYNSSCFLLNFVSVRKNINAHNFEYGQEL